MRRAPWIAVAFLCVAATANAMYIGKNGGNGGGGGGGSSTPSVTAYTANATVPDSALERGFVDNTGATSNITLTLPACTSTVDSGVFYVTVANTITIAPNGTDQVAVGGLNCTAGHSVSSDANIGTFVGLSCLASGKWYLTGINGGWTCN